MPDRLSGNTAALRVQTLGAFEIRGADGQPVPAGRQPKRQAVLLHLLLARPYGIHRRDSVLGVFWPDSPRARASQSLSQALNWLKRELKVDIAVRPSADEVGIDDRVVWCDARAFVAALAAGEHERALELYRGELTPGLHVQGCGEFERWLEAERRHLSSLAVGAAEWLLSKARQRGDDAAALRWARRWRELDPYSEEAVRGLVEVYAERGDAAAAVLAYEEYAHRLAEDLQMTPSAETTDRIRHLRRSHSAERAEAGAGVATLERRAPAAVPALEAATGERPAPSFDGGSSGESTAAGRSRRGVLVLGALLLIAVLGIFRLGGDGAPPPTGTSDQRIAVMFFKDDSPEQGLSAIASGITVALTNELASLEGLSVASTTRMRAYQGTNPPLDTLRNVAPWVVAGSISGSGDTYRVNVELVNTRTAVGTPLPRLERSRDEIFALIDDVVREVAEGLREHLGREFRYGGWEAGTNVWAWRAAIQADKLRLDAEAERQPEEQVRLLDRADSLAVQAIAADRRWAEAWVLRGRIAEHRAMLHVPDRAVMQRDLDRARAYADSSLARAENADAYELRGVVLTKGYLFMPPSSAELADALLVAAEADLSRALDLDARRPLALSFLAQNLHRQGRFEDAFAAGRRAMDMDVFLEHSVQNVINMFTYAFHMGDDAEAANYCAEVGRLAPDTNMFAYCRLDQLAWGERMPQLALQAEYAFENAGSAESERDRRRHRPIVAMKYAAALARAGQEERARAVIAAWRDSASVAGDLRELEAAAWTAVGEPDTAISLLREVLEARPASRSRILAMRYFEPLAELPEFRALEAGRAESATVR